MFARHGGYYNQPVGLGQHPGVGQGSPAAYWGQQQRTKNEQLAESLGLPKEDVDKIVNLPMDEFSTYVMYHNFTEEQMNVIRDIRRRGKNLVAAHKCRRRKMDEVEHLQERLEKAQNKFLRLRHEEKNLKKEEERLKIQLREVETYAFMVHNTDPSKHRIDYGPDGQTVRLIPMDANQIELGINHH